MTGSTRRWLLVALLALAMPTLAGCATTTATGGRTDVSCVAFEPFRWSRRDTEETVRQAKEHNAAWHALCNRKGNAR